MLLKDLCYCECESRKEFAAIKCVLIEDTSYGALGVNSDRALDRVNNQHELDPGVEILKNLRVNIVRAV